jgi:hypothetical protein
MKKSIIFLALVSSTLLTSGQISIGLSAGSNLATTSISLRDLSTFKINPSFGFNANLIVEYNLNPTFSLWSGLSISQKGFNQHIKYYYRPDVDSTADITSKLTYLEMPIYFKFTTNIKESNFFYGVGPYIAYGIKGKITTEITGRNNSTYVDIIKWDKSTDYLTSDLVESYGYSKLKRFDFGIGTIVGYKYKNFMVTASYKFGLHNFMWEYSQDEKMSNSCLSLSVGYFFNDPFKSKQL